MTIIYVRHFGYCQWREGYYKYIDEDILDKFPLLTKYKQFIGSREIIQQFNILWRQRHKGFKLKNPKYPKCFVWTKRTKNEQVCDAKNGTDYNALVILAVISFIVIALIRFFLSRYNDLSNDDDHCMMPFGIVIVLVMIGINTAKVV